MRRCRRFGILRPTGRGGASIAGSYRIDCKLAFHFEPFFRFTRPTQQLLSERFHARSIELTAFAKKARQVWLTPQAPLEEEVERTFRQSETGLIPLQSPQ